MKRLLLSVFLIALGSGAVALAQSQKTDIRPNANRVVGEALIDEFRGITHEGAYNFTDAGDPRRFYTETHFDDGRTTYLDQRGDYEGRWEIKNEALCFTYEHIEMNGGCFRVYKVGNCFYYYNVDLIEHRNELGQDYWTARSVKAGEIPTCEPGLS